MPTKTKLNGKAEREFAPRSVSRRRTVWAVRDRQGDKWFASCPPFASGFDIFNGNRIQEPKNKHRYRVVRKFKVRVTGQMVGRYGYKPVMQVG